MTDQELRKLRRDDLLQILIAQQRQIDELNDQIAQRDERIRSRDIDIRESGSIAEAALRLNNVFADAQAAADQFTEQSRRQAETIRAEADATLADARKQAGEIISRAKTEAEEIVRAARARSNVPAVEFRTPDPEPEPEPDAENKRFGLFRKGGKQS